MSGVFSRYFMLKQIKNKVLEKKNIRFDFLVILWLLKIELGDNISFLLFFYLCYFFISIKQQTIIKGWTILILYKKKNQGVWAKPFLMGLACESSFSMGLLMRLACLLFIYTYFSLLTYFHPLFFKSFFYFIKKKPCFVIEF